MGYQSIYDRLRANGLTEAGALGMLGNWDCESNCIACRLQGDFKYPYNASKEYANGVDSGSISRQQFANDGKGYGLAQWTFCTRKENLYDFCKNLGVPIDNEAAQVAFALKEMPTEAPGLLEQLKTSDDLWACTDHVCRKFERPYYNNVDDRFRAATRIKNEIDLNPGPVPPQPDPPQPDPPQPGPTICWPPRTIDYHCMDWPEVTVVGAVLYCRGYINYAAGAWDDEVTEAVKDFQRDNGLDPDGVVGPKTYMTLFEMG